MQLVSVTILVPLSDINIEADIMHDKGNRDTPESYDVSTQIDINGMDYEIESWDETLVDEKAIENYKADL